MNEDTKQTAYRAKRESWRASFWAAQPAPDAEIAAPVDGWFERDDAPSGPVQAEVPA